LGTSLAASPLFLASLLRVIAVAVLGTELLLLWTSRRGSTPSAAGAQRRHARLSRLMWVATPALVLIVLSVWSAASVAQLPAPDASALTLTGRSPDRRVESSLAPR
jgi:heme/copper-type cytochrome/quinol oxidase subunit 2